MNAPTGQTLEQRLRERGHRVTPQRLFIHRALEDLGRHATADEVLDKVSKRLPNASLPTVYSTLELFDRMGMVRRIAAGPGPALYDPRVDDHQHLVCRRCGAVDDLDAGVDSAPALRAARRHGFTPSGAELVVTGLCARCSRKRG